MASRRPRKIKVELPPLYRPMEDRKRRLWREEQVQTMARKVAKDLKNPPKHLPTPQPPSPKIRILRVDIVPPVNTQVDLAIQRLEALWEDAVAALSDYDPEANRDSRALFQSPPRKLTNPPQAEVLPTNQEPSEPSLIPEKWTAEDVGQFVLNNRGAPLPEEIRTFVRENPQLVQQRRVRVQTTAGPVRFYIPREWLSVV